MSIFSFAFLNFSAWTKTSKELKSQVDSSAHQKMAMMRSPVPVPPPPGASPSMFKRLTGLFTGSASAAPEAETASAKESDRSSKSKGKRSYGFASSQFAYYTDRTSEDMYRYKNFSSEQMRSSSPIREDSAEPIILLPPIEDKDDEADKKDQTSESKPTLPEPDNSPKE
jgi:hypothetical protein